MSSDKNHELKVKLWWVGACYRKKNAFFITFILSQGHLLNICVLSQCIVYQMNFQNICTSRYKKYYLIHFCFLFLKSSKAFSVFLNWMFKVNSNLLKKLLMTTNWLQKQLPKNVLKTYVLKSLEKSSNRDY